MHKTLSRFVLFFLPIVLGLPGFALGTHAMEIPLGALLPLTGSASSNGASGKAAVEVAVEDINTYFAREGIPAHVSLTIMDTATDPTQTLAAIQTLANQGIRSIVGPYASSSLAAIQDYASQNEILVLSPASSSVDLSLADTIFRMVPDDTLQGLAIAYFVNNAKIKTVIPVYMNDTFGNSLYNSTLANLQSLGLTYTEGIPFDPNTTDYTAISQTLRTMADAAIAQTGSASAVAVHLIAYNQTMDLFRSVANDPVLSSLRWIGNDGIAENPLLLSDPIAADVAAKTGFVCPIYKRDDTHEKMIPSFPMTQLFQRKLARKLGAAGDNFAANAYDATFLLALTNYYSNGSTDTASRMAAFADACNLYVGYTAAIVFNSVGDRDLGAYGFYTVTATPEGSYRWKTAASFRFQAGKPLGKEPFTAGGFELPQRLDNFTISALLPLTGELSHVGQSSLKAIRIAVDDMNFFFQTEGVSGGIQLNAVDTQTDPQTALAKMEELSGQNSSHVLIGPYASSTLNAVREYAQTNNYLLISPGSTLSAITGLDDNVYCLMLDNIKEAEAIANLYRELDITAVIPLWRNDLYGSDLKAALEEKFENFGGLLLDGLSYEANQTDFAAVLAALEPLVTSAVAQHGQKHVAVQLISYEEAEPLFATARNYPQLASVQWLGCDGNFRLDSIPANPQAAAFAAQVHFAAIAGVRDFLLDYDYDPARRVVRADIEGIISHYLQTSGSLPSIFDYGSYDALWMAALVQLHSGIGATDISTMRKNLIALSKVYIGLNGLIAMTDAGDQKYGVFGFSSIRPTGEDTYAWKYTASYRFTLNQGNLFLWYDRSAFPGAVSHSHSWEIYP